jgi:hypothetical protein
VSTTTIDDQLAEVRRRIERLRALTSAASSPETARTKRRLDGLTRLEAAARSAAHHDPEELAERLAELNTRLDVAEHALAADLAEDRAAFAVAVEAELKSWDTYLERLQTNVAAKASNARERSETAIGGVRARRIAVEEHLSRVRAGTEGAWRQETRGVTEARDELERTADALSVKLTSTKSK